MKLKLPSIGDLFRIAADPKGVREQTLTRDVDGVFRCDRWRKERAELQAEIANLRSAARECGDNADCPVLGK